MEAPYVREDLVMDRAGMKSYVGWMFGSIVAVGALLVLPVVFGDGSIGELVGLLAFLLGFLLILLVLSEWSYRNTNYIYLLRDRFEVRNDAWGLRRFGNTKKKIGYDDVVSIEATDGQVKLSVHPLIAKGWHSSMQFSFEFHPVDAESLAAEMRRRVEIARTRLASENLASSH
jgi:hypothetical protein